jgi:hypothetical protein
MKTFLSKLIKNLESEAFYLDSDDHKSYIALHAIIRALKATIEEQHQPLEIEEDNIPF